MLTRPAARNPPPRPLHRDFKPGQDHLVGLPQVLTFFSRGSRTISNKDFEAMIRDMDA